MYPETELDEWAPYRERYLELFAGDSWRLPCPCHLVREGGQTVLVDTGAGPPGMWQNWETLDAVPHPALFEHPKWRFAFDEDPGLASETRRRLVTGLEEDDLV